MGKNGLEKLQVENAPLCEHTRVEKSSQKGSVFDDTLSHFYFPDESGE
jgi:hypothetical protein